MVDGNEREETYVAAVRYRSLCVFQYFSCLSLRKLTKSSHLPRCHSLVREQIGTLATLLATDVYGR
jgi:hypothetical protein